MFLQKRLNGVPSFFVRGRQNNLSIFGHHEPAHKVPLHLAQACNLAESLVGRPSVVTVHVAFGEHVRSFDALRGTEGLHFRVAARLCKRKRSIFVGFLENRICTLGNAAIEIDVSYVQKEEYLERQTGCKGRPTPQHPQSWTDGREDHNQIPYSRT